MSRLYWPALKLQRAGLSRERAARLMVLVCLAAVCIVQVSCGGSEFQPNGFTNTGGSSGNGGQLNVPPPPITVTVSPSTANLAPGAQMLFSAAVTGTTNHTVVWTVNGIPGGNLTVGTISSNGNYDAPQVPPVPNSVTVAAVSVVDPNQQGTALVVITAPPVPVTVSTSPASAAVQTGAALAFSAVVQNTANTAVTWSVNGIPGGNATLGTITGAGIYTAPAAVPANPTVSVTATSVADPSASGSSTVTIQQRVQVSISPTLTSVGTFLTQQFVATVTGTATITVIWAVNGTPGGNATVGTIDATGLYTAPATLPTPNTVTVSATSTVDPTASGTGSVRLVNSPGVTVSVAPGSSTLDINQSLLFVATVTGLYRGLPPSNQVQWHANNLPGGSAAFGFIAPTPCPVGTAANASCGLYTAPAAVPFPNTIPITAYSITDASASGTASVLITAPTVVTVSVAPSATSVQVGTTQQFTATVAGTANQNVTWNVTGAGCVGAACGTISPAGLYTAPAAVPAGGSVTVAAASVVDPTALGSATATILAAPPPIAVSVSPASSSLRVNSQLQFTSTVSGTANQSVTWSLSGTGCAGATCGTITAAGLYTAPAAVPVGTVTVRATSVVAPNPSNTASVTIQPLSTIAINPTAATVNVGLGVQFFVTITGQTNTAVNYAVNGVPGGNASVGTISASGLYIAPAALPAPNPVTVTATSVADPTLVATATVTVQVPVAVSVAPPAASIALAATQQFTATVTGTATTTVTWAVNGIAGGNATVGTITAAGLYTAPTNLLLTSSFNITARSTVDPTAVGNAVVLVIVPVSVSVSPTTASVQVGRTQQFNATVTGSTNTSVTWSVSGTGCTGAACGTVSGSGLYTAPAAVPGSTVTVTATSVADPTKTASATVTVTPGVSVSVSPATVSLSTGGTQLFTATVTGTAVTTVTWSVGGACGATCGSIAPSGLYTAPATVPPGTVTVTATSQDGSNTTGTATVTVQAAISVAVAPAAASIVVGQTQQFTATVSGTANQTVTWTLSGAGCTGAACGTITSGGLYTAPAAVPAPATVTVTATSAQDPTKSSTATVTVVALPAGVIVSVFPRSRNLPIGRTQQFKAHVIRISDQSVNWSVNGIPGGNSTVGTVDSTGLYSPPSTQPAQPNITLTATSVSSPTSSMTVNARIVPRVDVAPASAKIQVNQTKQFTATVSGVSNTAVTWAVNGIAGGNTTVGTISGTGLYTAPGPQPSELTTITATSAVDPAAVGVATLRVHGNAVRIFPGTVTVLPGGRVFFQANVTLLAQPTTTASPVIWRVNGVLGGNASVGTITPAGIYTAPATPQTVTVQAVSSVDPTRTATSTVTIGVPSGASPVGLTETLFKLRPYDVVSSNPSMTLDVAGNQYASWQVVLEGRNEDLSGVNVSVSDFTDSFGNRIPASNAVIYLEKFVNAFYASREQGDIGEWPDPLIPKVDPFVNETRNAFPFNVRRISPAYKQYPRVAGETSNTTMGAGRATSGGTYAGSSFKHFVATIDTGGPVGSSTFKWSNDGGATFAQTLVPTSSSPIPLSDGVTISFQPGGVAGVTDFRVGDSFWVFAGPIRTQPVWVDLYVPASAPAGTYNGTVTVVRSGKANVNLSVQVNVKSVVIPVTSTIPSYFGMNWTHLLNAHFNTASGPQTLQLGQLYGVACLINRITCEAGTAFPPTFTFDATTGAVTSSSYTAYDQATAPLANGSITPHAEQLTSIRLPRAGNITSEQYFATENMLNAYNTRGWRSRAFDFSFDEPGTSGDFQTAMARSSLVRSVDPALRTVVTTDISQFNYNLLGYVNRWTPEWTTLDNKEFLDGPNSASRAFYEAPVAAGDQLWWYPSCRTHSCAGTGPAPRFDNYPAFTVDVPAVQNREWGLLAISPFEMQGLLYQNTVLAYSRFFNMAQPKIDVWDSAYYLGGNGEGTLFYPGRPADIGGTTHIPVESLRLKQIRDALVDQEIATILIGRGDEQFVDSRIANELNLGGFTYSPDPASYASVIQQLVNRVNAPPPPAGINVPAAGGCYTDPETGNRVCRVTDPVVCPNSAAHYYSYWPVWNQSGSHLIVSCVLSASSTIALLVDNATLAPIGDALRSLAGGDPGRVFWSWVNPNLLYARAGNSIFQWNPFTQTGSSIKNFAGLTVGGRAVTGIVFNYVSFDDRFFLLELNNGAALIGLATYDRVTDQTNVFDLSTLTAYDESVFTKDNHVWVIANLGQGLRSLRYNMDFTGRLVVASNGHHAHGILQGGTPTALREASDKDCPGGGWRPTVSILDERIDSSANLSANTIAAELFKVACSIPGQHHFAHFSWNNTQVDRFFAETFTYSPPGVDPIANAVVRVRLTFNASNQIIADAVDVIARHRSDVNLGYFAQPRATCNQQGTRCLFSSSMTVGTNKTSPRIDLYVVDVP